MTGRHAGRGHAARPAREAETRRTLDRLRALRHDPVARSSIASEALAGEKRAEILLALLDVLVQHPVAGARDDLLAALDYLGADPRRRDPGGFVRAAALRALAPVALGGDEALFLDATRTYEPSATDGSAPAVLRAAGLAGLLLLDEREAIPAAVRLLADGHRTSKMNGEPALTAARALAAAGETMPLYLFVLVDGPSEVIAECLKGLVAAPAAVVNHVLEQSGDEQRELVLLGLCDLITGAEAEDAVLDHAARLLRTVASDDVYAYLVAAIVAGRRPRLIAALLEAATQEQRPKRVAILAESLLLLPGEEARHVAETLAARPSRRK